VLALPVDPEKAVRNGPEPVIVELRNAADEAHYAAALIESWLRSGIEIRGHREPVAAHDIGILYPRIREDAMHLLRERLNTFTHYAWLSSKNNAATLQDDGVRIVTIKGSRGLQFRIVVLIWADLLPYQQQLDERSELYVAMTRAEDVLVILHSGRSAYIDELRARSFIPSAPEIAS
jgi:ATP-dependent exoDNAse (exonuclease V) beta subunit